MSGAAAQSVGNPAVAAGATDETESRTLLSLILDSLDQDKAEEVSSIDLRGKSSIADHMVVASGRSARQVSAIAEKLVERVKASGRTARVEGKEAGDWVLIDAGDVIVHVFRPEVRDFYQLEKMWMTAPDMNARPVGSA
jgi:ribosome-associated protein